MSSNVGQASRITSILLITSTLGIAVPANSVGQDIDHFTVRVYSNSRGSQELLTGRYDEALARLEARGIGDASPFEAATNLCVAQMMAGQFDSARTTCDVAVKNARSSLAVPHWGPSAGASQTDVAIAYNNRAVLHWLTDDTQSAASDLAQAKRFAPGADFVASNLTALNAQDRTTAPFRLAR